MPTAVWFSYSPHRNGIHPQQHLAGYNGILQPDAHVGYNALYGSGRATEAVCMAYARRKIHPTTVTAEALSSIGVLYAFESEIRSSPAEERLAVRKARMLPMM